MKTPQLKAALAATALTCLPSLVARAATPSVKFGGLIFSHYGLDLTEDAGGANEFDISRVYIDAKATLSDNLSSRVTLDVGRLKSQHAHDADAVADGKDTRLTAFLKYAYLQWRTPVDGVAVQIGAAGTGWTGLYDKFWGRRWVSKSFADQAKLLATSDIGLHASGAHAGGMLGWQGAVTNGSGYDKPEGDKAKTVQLRVTVDPLAGGAWRLPVSAFVSRDVGGDEDPVTLAAGAVGLKTGLGLAWAELLHRSEGDVRGQGLSLTVVPHVGKLASLLGRLDLWDPDTDTDDDASTRIIAGVTRDFAKKVSAGLLYERTALQGIDEPDHGVFARMQAGF